ncbi:MAG TPA: FAD-binding oxidoreductase [Amycolatopsis sp.]|uniref:FAD-binding oxidoreductase n=1 Tax=Amycolatopsis sp. TaxID=37632 RepID=UPI002B48E9CD|nr:FAD-binding oxidoreductase [Amycolatopsis sp.]HKS49770.1 FAD-binding oxidoreductase [Amycolatopsis sp.]
MALASALVLGALREVTSDRSRPAGPGDEVDGVAPLFVAAPAGTRQASEVMRIAAENDLAVVARGAGTKLTWGQRPSRAGLVVETGCRAHLVEHHAGDLVAHAEAGFPLARLQARLATRGQRLAVDPVVPGGTLGGIVATGVSGPLRLSYGGVRDLLIGVTMVRADGVVAKAGGKVVKNVAGYDLGKLLTGSFGTLGLITETIFRLHPLPARSRWVVAPAGSARAAHEVVQEVIHAQVVPAALELDRPSGTVAVLVEGTPEGVSDRVRTVRDLMGGDAEVRETPPEWWGKVPWGSGEVALRLTHEIAGLPKLLDALDEAAERTGSRAAVRGSPGAGLLYAGLAPPTAATTVAAFVGRLRDQSAAWSGDVVVLDGPPPVKAAVEVWGPVRGLNLMRRVKNEFDPGHRLAPGRFVGGI